MSSIKLVLKKSEAKCKLEDMSFKEDIDVLLLNRLIKSDLLVKNWDDMGEFEFCYDDEKTQLSKLRKNLNKDNTLTTKYSMSKKVPFGRIHPKKSLSWGCVRKEIRHTLCKGKYVDIDMANCQPNILNQICAAHKIENKYLNRYVTKRDSILLELSEHYSVDRVSAKALLITLLYSGTFECWAYKNHIDKPATKFVQNFAAELNEISEHIVDKNVILSKALLNAPVKKQNKNGRAMSFYLGQYEKEILSCMVEYMIDNTGCGSCVVLCFDGFMVKTESYKEGLLKELEEEVKSKTGIARSAPVPL
jgi:hypothetical protein